MLMIELGPCFQDWMSPCFVVQWNCCPCVVELSEKCLGLLICRIGLDKFLRIEELTLTAGQNVWWRKTDFYKYMFFLSNSPLPPPLKQTDFLKSVMVFVWGKLCSSTSRTILDEQCYAVRVWLVMWLSTNTLTCHLCCHGCPDCRVSHPTTSLTYGIAQFSPSWFDISPVWFNLWSTVVVSNCLKWFWNEIKTSWAAWAAIS